MKKIFFRVDASKEIGYGHFIRCLALADILKADFECVFFCQTPTEFQRKEIRRVCTLIALPDDDSKFEVFLEMLKGDEIVVLDNYFFTSNYQKAIKEKGCRLVCIGPNDKHYYADLLFNYVERDPIIFSKESYTQVCLGLEWMLLRKPFLLSGRRDQVNKLGTITICFGGTDQFQLTERCLSVITKKVRVTSINLIATDSLGEARISKFRRSGISCYVNISAEEVASVFSMTDFALVSASTIAQEALACGATVLCGYYVDNQEKMYHYLLNEGYIIGLGNLLCAGLEDNLIQVLRNYPWNDKCLRKPDFSDLDERYIAKFKELC